jgi:3-deoxy-D-manno-octulosonic-acid transferase
MYCAAPSAFAVVLWRGLRNRAYWQGLGERFGYGPRISAAKTGSTEAASTEAGSPESVWLHAVSLGEMSAAAPLVRALRAKYPQNPLVLTTATPTGRARAKILFGDAVDVRFLPYDTPGSVARFLDRVRPRLAVIMETELWPNLFAECERRGMPLVLASARLSQRSVARYQRLGNLFRGMFSAISLLAAQTREDAERFIAIGAPSARTHVAGNIKFDVEMSDAVIARGRDVRAALGCARPVWVAGSTHAGEEDQVLAAHAALPGAAQPGGVLLLLAPRHPDRFDAVAAALEQQEFRFARWSGGLMPGACVQVVLVDTVGELQTLYAAADAAFVGGSLVPIGGHNLLEPAALGLPVLTGPYYFNGKDIARLLLGEGAARQVRDARELAAALAPLLANPEERQRVGAIGRRIVAANRGSVARVLELIEPLLPDPVPPAAPSARPAAGC